TDPDPVNRTLFLKPIDRTHQKFPGWNEDELHADAITCLRSRGIDGLIVRSGSKLCFFVIVPRRADNRCNIPDKLTKFREVFRTIPTKQAQRVDSPKPQWQAYGLNRDGHEFIFFQRIRCLVSYISRLH